MAIPEPSTQRVTSQEVSDFIRLLLTYDNLYVVAEDGTISYHDTPEEPIMVELASGQKAPMRIIMPTMDVTDDCVRVNPFDNTIKGSAERNWFWRHRTGSICFIVRRLIRRLVEGITADTLPPSMIGMFDRFIKAEPDDKFLEILKKHPNELCTIFYDRKSKTAQFQCTLLQEEWRTTNGVEKQFRKKDLALLEAFMLDLCGCPPENLIYKATLATALEADAILHVLVMVLERLDVPCQQLLDQDLKVAELKAGLEKLPDYQRCTAWYNTAPKSTQVVGHQPPAWERHLLPTPGRSYQTPGRPAAPAATTPVASPAGPSTLDNYPTVGEGTVTPVQSQPAPVPQPSYHQPAPPRPSHAPPPGYQPQPPPGYQPPPPYGQPGYPPPQPQPSLHDPSNRPWNQAPPPPQNPWAPPHQNNGWGQPQMHGCPQPLPPGYYLPPQGQHGYGPPPPNYGPTPQLPPNPHLHGYGPQPPPYPLASPPVLLS